MGFLFGCLLFVCLIILMCSVVLIRECIRNYRPIYFIASILILAAALGLAYIAISII